MSLALTKAAGVNGGEGWFPVGFRAGKQKDSDWLDVEMGGKTVVKADPGSWHF